MVKYTFRKSLLLLIAGLLLAFPLVAQTIEIYIAVDGSDSNAGTRAAPLATIAEAQKKVRTIKAPVVVYLRGGTYYLSEPVVFGPADSRKPHEKVIYKAFASERVVISGAKALSPTWSPAQGSIRVAAVAEQSEFDQLFLNGQPLRMARYPNYDSTSSHFGGYAADVLDPQRIGSWKNPEGAYLHALHKNEWGGYHYRVLGTKPDGTLQLEGGYQNNRQMGMHPKYRFIENIFEELDTVGEWYFDKAQKRLFLYPPSGTDLTKARIVSPHLRHLFEFRGSESTPVRNITLEGMEMTQTVRTFMDTREPLLRSDWAIYRGGAVVMEGTEDCAIRRCHFVQIGGNAVFITNYNRRTEVSGCHIEYAGASGVCLVGDPDAVRSPSFEYNQTVAYAQLDKEPGPKTNNYPAECRVYDNLMHELGQVEKQVAGVQTSMAMRITVSHNTIYKVPRAGINVSEGTWGGHIIEFNDVFNTVLETGDHGAFNSWGRDRYWQPKRAPMNELAAAHPELILLDAVKTTVIRNNRFRCDHGWDIDLDDGSSNYHIYNNVCLNGGLKLREGFQRVVENNVIVNNSFHPHVWFKNSGDVFRRNIVLAPYYPIRVEDWGKEVDFNLFPDQKSLEKAQQNGTDAHSRAGNPLFINPEKGNFQVNPKSPALGLGFKNFSMDEFGVVSPALKALADAPTLPAINAAYLDKATVTLEWLGGKLRNVHGAGDRSAYGLPDETGIIVGEVPPGSILAKSSVQSGDVIRKMQDKEIETISDLTTLYREISWTGKTSLEVIRNQQPLVITILFK
jgi:hypothetical protein